MWSFWSTVQLTCRKWVDAMSLITSVSRLPLTPTRTILPWGDCIHQQYYRGDKSKGLLRKLAQLQYSSLAGYDEDRHTNLGLRGALCVQLSEQRIS